MVRTLQKIGEVCDVVTLRASGLRSNRYRFMQKVKRIADRTFHNQMGVGFFCRRFCRTEFLTWGSAGSPSM
jgi:hypothetical protein